MDKIVILVLVVALVSSISFVLSNDTSAQIPNPPPSNVPPLELPPQDTQLSDSEISTAPVTIDTSSVPDAVLFDLHNATVECPIGPNLTDVKSTVKNHGALDEYVYSTGNMNEFYGKFEKHTYSETKSADFVILWGDVYNSNTQYALKGFIHDTSGKFCAGNAPVFDFTISGACDGSIFSLYTTNPKGYSITASGNQVSAACLHP